MLISLTVGKVDAGVAVLLTEDKRLIEFPSILLPPSISSGSIVDINVSRNTSSEALSHKTFQSLQSSILSTYGQHSPSAPVLRCRNATQTSVVLEWDPIDLATADLRSLSLYRNGSKAGIIPRPLEITATKISGLAVDTEYVFYLILRTSAGQYSSEKLTVRTHKMTDLSGITVTPGVLPAPLRESLSGAVERIGAKLADSVRIDTTHFVCVDGRGREWERAVDMNIPVVRPEWIEGCEREGRIVSVRGYYLNADPRLRQVGSGVLQQSSPHQTTARATQPERNESQSSLHQQQSRTIPVPQNQASPPLSSSKQTPSQPPIPLSRTQTGDDAAPPPPAKDTPELNRPSVSSLSTSNSEDAERVTATRIESRQEQQQQRGTETEEEEGELTEVKL